LHKLIASHAFGTD